ncbi:hypothetical protein F4814DRAFT_404634 [Daldinia grandis]|nr:hypothetical protein F4814DRAFT_404634 [Daldinia grandis]
MDESLSSPDPLGDEPPSSAFPLARHTDNTLTHHDLSAISIPKSQIRRSSPAKQSPRRRTFELDVGNELAPQRLLVTVEAEEAINRGINRRLFQSSSPIRAPRRREAIMTTTIPLNDEIENEATPRRRGRPRRISNGTPMPRGKKRAATPMKETRRTRQKNDLESEASLADATPTGPQTDSVASKAKARVRKTPKSTSTTQVIPSSQLTNNTTKKKRGRPRKALMPEDVAILADAGNASSNGMANNNTAQSVFDNSENLPPPALSPVLDFPDKEEGRQVTTSDNLIDDIIEASGRTPTPRNASNLYEQSRTGQDLGSEAVSYQEEELRDSDIGMSDDYPALMEAHSDVESDLDNTERIPHSGQDTLAHASDFSMIAVESLPSFHANRSALLSDPPEMGEETNMIINQTLESWRNSTRTEAEQSLARSTASNLPAEEGHSSVQGRSWVEGGGYSPKERTRSPRRQRQLPLSRQVFAGKAPHVDDSFSSLPDSILKAATPGRLPMKPTSAAEQYGNTTVYEDEFSEISDPILEAATPKPATRVGRSTEDGHTETSVVDGQVNSVNRQTGPSFGSSRLPTPDDTSSSNAGSKKAREDEAGPSTREQDIAGPSSNSGFQSSPPIMNRPRAMDFGPSRLDQEINNTPELQHSSPQLPPSAKAATEPPQTLEPPPNSRPSLSPIVRVGRTLQDVMSDRPSPERRESSLGSPFRGSATNDPSQPFPPDQSGQLSIPKSPSRSGRGVPTQFNPRSLSGPSAALSQIRRASLSHSQSSAQGDIIANVSDPFNSAMRNRSQTESLRNIIHNTDDRAPEQTRSFNQSVSNSARAMPLSDNGISWIADDDNHPRDVNQGSGSQPIRSQSPGVFSAKGSNTGRAVAEATNSEVEEQQEQELEEQGDSALADYEAEEGDIWDFEASRQTPRRPERTERTSQHPDQSTRRTKVPSPWKKTSRRLIYREEIASSSQIEIEENPQSETEDGPLVRQRPRASDAHSILQGWNSEATRIIESSSPEAEQQIISPRQEIQEQLEIQEQPESREHSEARELSVESEEPEEPAVREEPRKPREPVKTVEAVEPAEASEYSMVAQRTEAAPATQQKPKSRLFGGFDIMSFFSSPAALPKKTPEAGPTNATGITEKVAQPVFQKPLPKETTSQPPKEPQKSLWSTGLFSSIPQQESQPSPEPRANMFSTAPPSQSNDRRQESYAVNSPSPSPSPAPSLSPAPDSPEPPSQSLQQSPEPSPGSSPKPSPGQSLEQESPEQPSLSSSHRSTPERQAYPPIEQKRNFTPRPGQSSLSLFRSGPPPSRSEADEDLLLLPSDDQDEQDEEDERDEDEENEEDEDEYDGHDEQQEQQDSSLLTDGTDYERFPPRDVPSRWDRTLSPSKSCFRSPMKPTTPGRVVAFMPSALSSTAQAQTSAMNHQNGVRNNVGSQGTVPKPIPENTYDESTDSSSSSSRSTDATSPTATNPPTQALLQNGKGKSTVQSRRPTAFALSKTEWTRHHWVRLDELLQLRRYDPLAFRQQQRQRQQRQQKQQSWVQSWWRRQPPSPDASSLIGKEVAAQGERLILEQWHVEVVEAFAREVGGWSENALAKRVFALIVGEEKRRTGRAGRIDKGKERAVA